MGTRGNIPTPLGQRLRRARVGALPMLIWVAGVAMATRLWFDEPADPTYHGLAHATQTQVASPLDGELQRLFVGLYQTVDEGDLLGTFDTSDLQARIATERAELRRLDAEREAQRASITIQHEVDRRDADLRHAQATAVAGLEYPAELRAFHANEADLELKLLMSQLEITASQLEADRLAVRVRRAKALADDEIGPRAEVDDRARRLTNERARVNNLRLLEAGQKAALEQARARRIALTANYVSPPRPIVADPALDTRIAGWRAAMVVQERRLDELALRAEAHLLRAPRAGRVAALTCSEGQFLLAGDPVLVLMDGEANEVELWVPETATGSPRLGERFVVSTSVRPALDVAECVVQVMSPRLELMPERLWRDARRAEYGRVCLLGPVAVLGLTPGERVNVDPLSGSRYAP